MHIKTYKTLFEATLDQAQNRTKIWAKQYFENNLDKTLEIIPDIIAADPTNGKYSEWLIKQWKNGTARFPEDTEKLTKNLTLFNQKKSKLDEKDINKYTPASLAKTLEAQLGLTQSEIRAARHGKLVLPPGTELVIESGKYQVVKITEVKAMMQLATHTEWCVANEEYAEKYLKDGPFYLVYVDGKRDVLIHFESNQFMDVYDDEVSFEYKYELIDLLEPITGKSTKNDPKLAFNYAYEVIEGRWPEGEKVIFQNPSQTLEYVYTLIGKRLPEAEAIILQDPDTAYNYAKDIIKGEWPEAENIISQDPRNAYDYAVKIVNKSHPSEDRKKRRWPKGEAAISQDPQYSFNYAYMLGERFIAGEEIIMYHPTLACEYAYNIIRGRWPEAETKISHNAHAAYQYAVEVINDPSDDTGSKKRWPMGEAAISEKPECAYNYAKDIIKGRWPMGEAAISADPQWAYLYARNIIKNRWPEGEEAINRESKYSDRYQSPNWLTTY